jgi:hypothetical protein
MVSLSRLWSPPGRAGRELRQARVKLVAGAALWLLLLIAAVLALAGCGNEAEDNAVEATEQNTVALGGIDYRVVRFRQLNPRIPHDRTLVAGLPSPGEGRAYYAAFITACNRSGTTRTPTSRIHLEDAFGTRFAPLAAIKDGVFAYRARPLRPGACLPVEDSPADRALDGAVLAFDVPVETAQKRPLILELERSAGGTGRAAARVQLDL